MALADGLSASEVERVCAEHTLSPRHGPELKWLYIDIMLCACIMGHAAYLLGEPVVAFEDDEADCFFQFFTRALDHREACIGMLDPEALARGEMSPDLADFVEHVCSQGTPPSSGWAQRFNTELGEEFERLCAVEDAKGIEAPGAGSPKSARNDRIGASAT